MADTVHTPRQLWQHPNPQHTDIAKFSRAAGASAGKVFKVGISFEALCHIR